MLSIVQTTKPLLPFSHNLVYQKHSNIYKNRYFFSTVRYQSPARSSAYLINPSATTLNAPTIA
jgi:hypothetical protein